MIDVEAHLGTVGGRQRLAKLAGCLTAFRISSADSASWHVLLVPLVCARLVVTPQNHASVSAVPQRIIDILETTM